MGIASGFGARYGGKVREKYAEITSEQRRKHKCPYCNNLKVKRIAAGIWVCKKCGSKFAAKAYSLAKKIILEEPTPEKEKIKKGSKENLDKKEKKSKNGNL